MSLKTVKAIQKETGKFTNYFDIINNQMRYALEIGKDKKLEITLKKKDLTVVKKEIVKRYYEKGMIGGFNGKIESGKKVTTVTNQYKTLCDTVIKIIKGENKHGKDYQKN